MRDNSITLACVGGTQSIYEHKFHQTYNQDSKACLSITHLAPRGQGEEEERGEEEEDVEAGERREHVHKVLLQLDVAVVQHADRGRVAKEAEATINNRESIIFKTRCRNFKSLLQPDTNF